MLANLVRSLTKRSSPLTFQQWVDFAKFNGVGYPITTMGSTKEGEPDGTFGGYAQGLLYANPAVFTCIFVRSFIFSEPRFKWRRFQGGQYGDLFGDQSLLVLEQPEPGKTTSDLLSVAEMFDSLGGNWYGVRRGDRIKSIRPDWVEVVFGSNTKRDEVSAWDIDVEVVGYLYTPGGPNSGRDPVRLDASQVAHFMPIPDPLAPWRGMSWLTPLIREVMGDNAASNYKLKFFEQGGTPNMVVKPPPDMGLEEAKQWKREFDASYDQGISSAYKYMYIGGGADATVVGKDFQQMDFRSLQGLSETRIAAASGLGAVIAQFSEGMQGSSLNAGNYGAARRRVADGTFRPLWTKMVGALSHIVIAPAGAELWYDGKHVPFLQEDAADDAKIQNLDAQSIRQLTDAGFEPDAVVQAVTSNNLRALLRNHSGLFSVQLQPPSDGTIPAEPKTPAPRGIEIPDDEISLEEEFAPLLS